MLAYTIIAGNYSAMAQVLATSFREHHPSARFAVVVVDRPTASLDDLAKVAEVVKIDDIDFGTEGFGPMAVSYDVTEFSTAVKPWAAKHFLRQGEDVVFYIDPDIVVFDEFTSLIDGVRSKSIALTPHCLSPMARDGFKAFESDIMMSGIYNLGFIGVGPGAEPFLEWWCERLRRDAIVDPANALFTDQRWIDLAVPIFDPYIERSSRFNVAYWNIDQRDLTYEAGRYRVDGEPLGFYHFSGYDAAHPHLLSKYLADRPRVLLSEHPVLLGLTQEYARLLDDAGHATKTKDPYSWGSLPPDIKLTRWLRRHYRDCMVRSDRGLDPAPPNPIDPEQYDAFVQWLADPIPNEPTGLSRYHWLVWNDRPDVQHAFPETVHGDSRRFFEWFWTIGAEMYAGSAVVPVPIPGRRSSSVAPPPAGPLAHGVRVTGYLRAESGVGEAGRLALQALLAGRVDAGAHAYSRSPARQQAEAIETSADPDRFDVNLVCVNADMLPSFAAEVGPEYFAGRYTIGQWFWELEEFPKQFDQAFTHVDEVWAATEHMRQAMAARTSKPVVRMPLPLLPPTVDPDCDRDELGLPDDRFVFLFNFDFLSVPNRKNPHGLIDAYRAAFGADDGTMLVIKTINGDEAIPELERIKFLSRDRTDIRIWDGYLPRSTQGALMAHCDAYVSLHRAEGLGLTLAEAMCLGKPVISTEYSGTVDFMDSSTAFLVPYQSTPIGKGSEPYPPKVRWAEPDREAAVEAMRAVQRDPVTARAVGERARQRLNDEFSAAACGARMRDRLEQIWRNR